MGIASRTITFRHADGKSRRYATSEVRALEFISAERINPRATSDRRLEAPAGTRLVVRTVRRSTPGPPERTRPSRPSSSRK